MMVSPAQDLQPASAPNRQDALSIGEEESHLAFAPTVADAPPPPVPGDQFQGQIA
jgi:hypothetical protein